MTTCAEKATTSAGAVAFLFLKFIIKLKQFHAKALNPLFFEIL